jgi:hypothetical protein
MSIYKQLNQSNVTTTTRVVRKQFDLHQSSLGIHAIQFVSNSTDSNLSSSYWNSLRVGFYLSSSANDTLLQDPLQGYGLYDKNNPQHLNKFNDSGSIFSIDQQFVGEGIQPKTFYIYDNSNSNEIIIRDDGDGNLYSTNASISKSGASSISSSDNYVGNIFYNYGLAVITETGSFHGTWDLSSATAEKTSPVMTSQNNLPYGFYFKPDGTKYWMIGVQSGSEGIFEYSLSGAWDVSTATYTGNSIDYKDLPTNQDAFTDVHFKYDGTKMYTLNKDTDNIHEWDLSTAWDITTTTTSQSFNVNDTDANPQGFYFRNDGLKVYMNGIENHKTYEMNMSTAWDITSITSTSQSFATSASLPSDMNEDLLAGITFKPTGDRMYTTGNRKNMVYEHRLSTAWDITTATYYTSKSIYDEETNIQGVQWKPDGTKMYIVGFGGDMIDQYDMPSASFYTDVGTGNYNVKYKSIQTLHSTEWSLPINPSEYNITNNPTAYKKDIRNTSASIISSQYRADYITGSTWSPYITTIGLYDKYDNLILIGRLSQPIQKSKATRIIFKIKKDW